MSQQPDTSLDAYEQVTPKMLSEHWSKILSAIKVLKLATGEEIAKEANMDYHQVMRRVSEMERAEILYKPGSKKNTSTGRQAYQYAIRGEDVEVPALPEKYTKGTTTAADHASFLIASHDHKKFKQTDIFGAD